MPKSGEHNVNNIDSFFKVRPSRANLREGETVSFLEDGKLVKQEKRNGVVYEIKLTELGKQAETKASSASSGSGGVFFVSSGGSSGTGDITDITAGTGLSGGGSSGNISLSIDSTVATLTGTQTLTNKTLTSPTINTSLTFDSVALTAIQTSAEAFTDNDTSIMTSAAIDDRILSYGYSTTTGTVTSVSGGNGLTGTITSSGSLNVGAGTHITVNADDVAVNTTTLFASPAFTGTATGVNLTLSGDLTVNGSTTNVDTTNLVIEDPLIKLAKNNSVDSLDIGFYGRYYDDDLVYKYTGLFRDASDNKFKLFTELQTEPTTTVSTSGTGYTTATLVANVEGSASLNLLKSNNLSDLGNASSARTNLGLGTAAVLNTAAVSDGATTLATGNAIYDHVTTRISGKVDTSGTPAAAQYARFTDSNTIEGRTSAQSRSDLGLVIGTNVQAQNASLQEIANLSPGIGEQGYSLVINDGSIVLAERGTVNSVAAGAGLSGGTITTSGTISHADTSTAANLTASSRTYVTGLTFDTYGHVTNYTTGTETVTDTNTTYSAGSLLDLSGTTFNVDLSEATNLFDVEMFGTDEFIILDGGSQGRKTAESINVSLFSNDAGYLTSASTINAATLDSLDSTQFLRSDTADTASGVITFSNRVTSTATGGFTIGNYAGYDRIQNTSNSFSFLTDGNGYANMTFGTVTAGTWNGNAIANAYIADLPTSKITSGTFSSARMPASFAADAVTKDDITTRTESGFYQTSTASTAEGWPTAGTYYHLLATTHSNDSNYFSMQIAGSFYDQNFYGRKTNNSGTTGWVQFLTSADTTILKTTTSFGGDVSGTYDNIVIEDDSHNHVISNIDGLQTALDGKLSTTGKAADSELLDGINGASFLRSDATDTASSKITFSGGLQDDATHIGYTTAHGIDGGDWSASEWSSLPVGFRGFLSSGGSSFGNPTSNYGHFLKISNRDTAGGWAGLWTDYNSNNAFYIGHTQSSSSYATWAKVWTDSNDGSTSGLDADLLDGVQGASYLRSDASDSYAGTLTFTSGQLDLSTNDIYLNARVIQNASGGNDDGLWIGYSNANSGTTRLFGGGATGGGLSVDGSGFGNVKVLGYPLAIRGIESGTPNDASSRTTFTCNDAIDTASAHQSGLQVWQDTIGADAFMTFHVANDYAVYFGLDGGTNDLAVGGWSRGANSYKIWHQGNDGSGSTLDADLLDGLEGSSYWTKSGSWVGDLGSNGYTRVQGVSNGGGEFVLALKSGQLHTLVDGSYIAYEASSTTGGGFWSSYNSAYGNASGFKASANDKIRVQQLDGDTADLEVTGNIKLTNEKGLLWDYTPNTGLGGYIAHPGGGMYRTNTGTHTGAITITIPSGGGPADMMSFWVDIFDYTTNESMSYFIAGYIYQTAGSNEWVNVSATQISNNTNYERAVRFGHNGTNHVVYIGELADTWSYPQITVRNVQVGFGVDVDTYDDNWDISFEASAFANVDETITNTLVQAGKIKMANGAGQFIHNATSSRDKIRVWNQSNYAIGMQTGFTFGGLGNNYAMTFQMNNQADRGFWWGDDGHGQAAGAMALTTDGKLTVAHSMRLGYGESDTTTPGAIYALDVSHAGSGLRISGSGDQQLRFDRSGGNSFSIEHDSSRIYLYNRTTSLASIAVTNAGNFGIGTVSPEEELHIFGNAPFIKIENNTEDFSGIIMEDAQDPGQNGRIGYDSGANKLYIQTHGGTGFTMDSSRNVGIGTTSPSYKLDVAGDARSDRLIFRTNASAPTADAAIFRPADNAFAISTNNTEKMRIDSAGHVGINETNPSTELHLGTCPDARAITFDQSGRFNGIGNYFSSNATDSRIDFFLSSGATDGTTNQEFAMYSSGNFHADADVIAYSTSVGSDIKLKKNVKDISYGLNDVLKIRAVEFDWKEKRQGKHDIGFIAQEIEKIIPEVVQEVNTLKTDGDTHKVVDYAKLTSVLIKAIQEQQQQINELKEKLNG